MIILNVLSKQQIPLIGSFIFTLFKPDSLLLTKSAIDILVKM